MHLCNVWKLIKKDFLVHIGRGSGITHIICFPAAVTFFISFITKSGSGDPLLDALLIWITVFPASLAVCGQLYSTEFEGGHYYFLRFYFTSPEVFVSKLIYNCIAVFSVFLTVFLLFVFFNSIPNVKFFSALLLFCTAAICIASVLSALGVIACASGGKNALLGILSIPLLLPPGTIIVHLLSGIFNNTALFWQPHVFLLSFSLFISVVSYLVFDTIWRSWG